MDWVSPSEIITKVAPKFFGEKVLVEVDELDLSVSPRAALDIAEGRLASE